MGCKYARKTQGNLYSFKLFGVVLMLLNSQKIGAVLTKELGNRNTRNFGVCIRLLATLLI